MIRCSYSVKVHTQPNTLKSGDRNLLKNKEPGNRAEKAKEKVFGNKNKRKKAHIDKPLGNKGRVVAKTKIKELLVPREGVNASLFWAKFTSYLQKKLDVTEFINRRVGLGKNEHTDVGLFMSTSTKAAVHLGQKDVENNTMFMNMYVEEIKYLFSIIQKLVLENYGETLNVEVIDSNDP